MTEILLGFSLLMWLLGIPAAVFTFVATTYSTGLSWTALIGCVLWPITAVPFVVWLAMQPGDW